MKKLLYHPEHGLWVGRPSGVDYDQGVLDVEAHTLPRFSRIAVGFGESMVLPSIDFETYSEAGYRLQEDGKVKGLGSQGKGGLPATGTPVYAEHSSTDVICLRYNLKDGNGVQGWMPGTPAPGSLLDYVLSGGLVEAWNVTFEFWIWNMVCVRKYGWPALPLEQLRCAMAKARRFSLPGSLDKAAEVLGTSEKDKRGKQLIQQLTRPHTLTKKRNTFRRPLHHFWDDYVAIYEYCGQDTVSEDAASAQIPDLTPSELETWQVDQMINVRGVQVDTEALDAAIDILEQAEVKYTAELAAITGGQVTSVSEVAKMKDWLNSLNVPIPDIQSDTVKTFLKRDMPCEARRVLEIRSSLGAANVKKLRTLKLQTSSDGRLRDQYTYCGADRTGRWSAGGVQLQNITAKGPKTAECENCGAIFGYADIDTIGCPRCGAWVMCRVRAEWDIEAVKQAIEDIKHRSLERVEVIWGDPIALLCGCLRGMFIAAPGKDLICADFSAIEAVVAACLARCQWRIDVFSTHGKIYEQSAANATGIPFEEILAYKKQNGTHHPARKGVGKIRELAGGYGGWIGAWKNFGADDYFPDDEAIKQDVLKWREESPEIVDMWGGQFRWCGPGKWDYRPELYGLEGMAIKAIQNPGHCFSYIDVTYGVHDDVLYCRLPSGRFLHYHRPRLVECQDKLNRGAAYQITFEGYNSNSAKGAVGWVRMETYGGRLFENVVQAVSADIQAEALKSLERAGYPVVMHTHDEAVCELPEGRGSIDEMVAIMSQRPEWAAWWPIKAAGWRDKRYQKD